MKFNLKFQIESAGAIVGDLAVERDAGIRVAIEGCDAVRGELARAEQRLQEARDRVRSLTVAVDRGEARVAELEAAIVAENAAARLMPSYADRVVEAEVRVEEAIRRARLAVVAEARARRDRLQRVADELAPALRALRDAEAALDQTVRAAGVPGVSEVPALEWPASLAADVELTNAKLVAGPARVSAK